MSSFDLVSEPLLGMELLDHVTFTDRWNKGLMQEPVDLSDTVDARVLDTPEQEKRFREANWAYHIEKAMCEHGVSPEKIRKTIIDELGYLP